MERSVTWRVVALGLVVALAWLAPACRREKAKVATREEVLALLEKEAGATKAAGENLDPALRMKATWTLTGVAVREQPQDADYPWAGTVSFRVRSEVRDLESVSVKESDRQYQYRWSRILNRWILQP